MNFAPFETQQQVVVTIANDQLVEGNEEFLGILILPAGSRGVVLGLNSATATIIDDDGERW